MIGAINGDIIGSMQYVQERLAMLPLEYKRFENPHFSWISQKSSVIKPSKNILFIRFYKVPESIPGK